MALMGDLPASTRPISLAMCSAVVAESDETAALGSVNAPDETICRIIGSTHKRLMYSAQYFTMACGSLDATRTAIPTI